jgi:hypothetical protein
MQFLCQASYHLFLGKQHPNEPKFSPHSKQMQGVKLNLCCILLSISSEFVNDPLAIVHEKTKTHHPKNLYI